MASLHSPVCKGSIDSEDGGNAAVVIYWHRRELWYCAEILIRCMRRSNQRLSSQ